MKLKIAQVVGLNTDQKAAQVVSSSREENTFLAVLDLSCDDAFTKGRQFLSELADFYFDFDGTPAEKLKAVFDDGQKKFDPQTLLVASISGKILYLISKGEAQVILKRAEKQSSLLSVGSANQLISGFLQEGDRLLLSTSSLASFLGDDLDKSLSLPIDTFEEEVTDRIGLSDLENQGLAGLAIEVQVAQPEAIPNLQQEEKQEYQHSRPVQEQGVSYDHTPVDTGSKGGKVKKIFAGILGFVWHIKKYFPKSGKSRLFIAIILILVIALGVGFKIKSSRDAQKQIAFNQALQESKDNFNAAKGLATLNPGEAKVKLDQALTKVNQALVLKPKDTEASNFKKQINDESSSILQESSVSDFPLFLDMDLVKKNFRASQMSLSSGKLLLLDTGVGTLAVVDLAKKSNQILAGSEQLGQATSASLNGGVAFVYSKDKGILRIDTTNQKLSVVAKKDSDLTDARDIYGFGGNVYLLDASKNMIWKYLPVRQAGLATSDGYSDKTEYLTKGIKVDFGSAQRMQIESSVYVMSKDGQMQRFTRGDKDNFSYGGLDKGVKDPKSFFVSSDTDNLYILDSGNSRLLILTKTGSYKGQIAGNKFATATDISIDEKAKKAYILDGSKIFQVDLK